MYVLVIQDRPDHPLTGTVQYCTCEAGQRLVQARIHRLFNLAMLPEDFADLTLDSYGALPGLADAQQFALRAARQLAETGYVESRSRRRPGLFLTGDVGLGKSGLAAGIVNAVVKRGTAALYITVPDLLDHLRATFRPNSDVEYDELFEQVRTIPLLVLDDLGTESPTLWAVEKLYQVVDHRYRNRLVTVVTSNLTPNELLAHFTREDDWTGKRIIDRLTTMCAVAGMQGRNLRK